MIRVSAILKDAMMRQFRPNDRAGDQGGLALGVLDQSPIREGWGAGRSIAETVALARAAERLGYRRYWVAEHHSSEAFAGTAPEILAAHLAAVTTTLRVG